MKAQLERVDPNSAEHRYSLGTVDTTTLKMAVFVKIGRKYNIWARVDEKVTRGLGALALMIQDHGDLDTLSTGFEYAYFGEDYSKTCVKSEDSDDMQGLVHFNHSLSG